MTNSAIKFLLVDDLESNLIALEGLLRRDGLELLKAAPGPKRLSFSSSTISRWPCSTCKWQEWMALNWRN
jgi:response regulator RpfG family c-di-GMP phosphodiesterase